MADLSINQVDVAKLNVTAGDVLAIKVDKPITAEMAARIRLAFHEAFAKGGGYVPEILVLGDGMTVECIKKDGAA